MKLRPITFEQNENTSNPGAKGFGLIAEEVYLLLPHIVAFNNNSQIESIQYDRLAVENIAWNQEQEVVIQELLKRVEALEKGGTNYEVEIQPIKEDTGNFFSRWFS